MNCGDGILGSELVQLRLTNVRVNDAGNGQQGQNGQRSGLGTHDCEVMWSGNSWMRLGELMGSDEPLERIIMNIKTDVVLEI